MFKTLCLTLEKKLAVQGRISYRISENSIRNSALYCSRKFLYLSIFTIIMASVALMITSMVMLRHEAHNPVGHRDYFSGNH